MLEDIKNKKIDVILIKDLSRLGRNYIETGNFVEVVFPAMGVSVISVDENYEIDSSDYYSDDYLALKNLFNDMLTPSEYLNIDKNKNVKIDIK